MRKKALFIFAVIFLANTLTLSAWAKTCMMSSAPQTSVKMSKTDMDCHKKKPEQNKKHCEGICLCEHAQANQTPILETPTDLALQPISFVHIASSNDSIRSLSPSPLKRPPKTIS